MTLKDLFCSWLRGRSDPRPHYTRLELEMLESRDVPAPIPIIVRTTDDNGDNLNPVQDSLRQAINRANENTDLDTIQFDLGDGQQFVFVRNHQLPNIVNPVIIDAQTTPDDHPTQQVTLTRSAVVADQFVGNGLVFTWNLLNGGEENEQEVSSSGSEVRSLTVQFFTGHGIVMDRVSHVELKGVSVFDNGHSGVMISGQAAHHNSITGSTIGKDDGGSDYRNKKYGVLLQNGAHDNTIGSPSSRNTITGNSEAGVFILDSSNNVINGNIIGLRNDGVTFANRTQWVGIKVYGNSTGNLVGSQVALAGGSIVTPSNVISGNSSHGVLIIGTSNRVQGNFVGTDITGLLKRGNAGSGVHVGNNNNTIGGAASEANVISGNGLHGVVVHPLLDTASGNTVSRNRIGIGNDGTTKIGNSGFGIRLDVETSGNTIIKNVVKENKKAGIPDPSGENFLLENITAANVGLGIDVGIAGVTLDGMPVLTSALVDGATTTVSGTLNSTPDAHFTIEIYANSEPDESGYGEGEFFLGTIDVLTDSSGDATFSLVVDAYGWNWVTATATDLDNGGTSEYSKNLSLARVGLNVFVDFNGNGIRDFDEGYSQADVMVILQSTDPNGDTYYGLIDATGHVVFQNVPPGNYTLTVVAPPGFEFAFQDQGNDDSLDSDVDASGTTDVFEVLAGEFNSSFAAGLIPICGNG